jgi:hypothetical protein
MERNPYKLITLFFSLDDNITHIIKKNIKKNLSNETNSIFLFINLQKYIIKDNKYSKFITKDSLPYMSFYFTSQHLARITQAEYSVFFTTYNKLKEQLSEHFKLAVSSDVKELAPKLSRSESTNENVKDMAHKLSGSESMNENVNRSHNLIEQSEPIENEEINNLTEQIKQQRKLEEIEKLKQQYLINELTKLKKAKEIQEKLEEK